MGESQSGERRGGVDESLARHGGLSYLEIPARDPRASAAFYGEVAGWTPDERSEDDVRFADRTAACTAMGGAQP